MQFSRGVKNSEEELKIVKELKNSVENSVEELKIVQYAIQ